MIDPRTPPIARVTAGFSTVGMLVYMTLLGLLLAPLVTTVIRAQTGFVESQDAVETMQTARFAHLTITRQLRMAGSHPTGPSFDGIDPDPDADGVFSDVRVRSDYNPPDGDTADPAEDVTFFVSGDTMYARWGEDGSDEPYLLGVDSLAFEYFDRDGAPITDPDVVRQRAVSARVTIRSRGRTSADETERTLVGRVRLRNME